ncbi:MAG TPA: ATP-binding protein [Rhodocyclaceae bacterium]
MTARHHSLSLGQRLLVGLLVVTFAYWAVIAWLTIHDTIDETYELFDAHLAQTAIALLRVTDPDDNDPVAIPKAGQAPNVLEVFSQWRDLSERLARLRAKGKFGPDEVPVVGSNGGTLLHALSREYEQKLRYQIIDRDGRILLRSANAPEVPMTAEDWYSENQDAEGQVWRHFGVWDRHHDFHVIVGESQDLRNQLVRTIAVRLVSPLVLGLPVLVFLLWVSITRGLDPLGGLTREIGRRMPDNLTPLDADRAPGEVRPMVQALNRLLQRMTMTLESERRFTANAAHELRTPLAAIQAQLHTARAAQEEAERERSFGQLQRAVERGIRLVSQLLTLARLDPDQALPDVESLHLGGIAEAVCAELAPLALKRGQTLELDIAPDVPPAAGNADMLSMLVANLVDNALRYTQDGGHVTVAVRCAEGDPLIQVCDDGPGIPAAQRERVFERFYRIATQDQPGTGLGLAICRRIAELHRACISLADGPGGKGLAVSVSLPAASGA